MQGNDRRAVATFASGPKAQAVIFGDIEQKFADGTSTGVLLFDPLGNFEDAASYRLTDLSTLARYLEVRCQSIMKDVRADRAASGASARPDAKPGRIESLTLTWPADANEDFLEFHVRGADECERLAGPIFAKAAAVKQDGPLRAVATLVVAFKDGQRQRIELFAPLGLVKINNELRQVDLSELQQHLVEKCRYISLICSQAKQRLIDGDRKS